ncbi:hypothetical protein [Agromyces lapidis]|uniref:TPM domain-containing protein n=1 Tax=Agromyces lapidis TaxID=279574 RepID=A0ABV5SPD1_9MICO|nr:hypothetical protein [Agromyces lapidis]
MPDALSWLPALVVFGAAALALAGAVVGLRRLGDRRERAELAAGRDAEVRAKQLIVQADEAVRDAEREIAFAEAQFGAAAARDTRAAVERARAWLREAFLLQQRLDDAESDTAAERRTWSARIDDLCRSALVAIDDVTVELGRRRRQERGAGVELPALRDDVAGLARRLDAAEPLLADLASRFAAAALAGAQAARSRAAASLARVDAALAEGEALVARAQPTAPLLAEAADGLERAGRDLDEVESIEGELEAARTAADEDAARLGEELAAARSERDRHAVADSAAALAAAVGEASEVLAARTAHRGDPVLDRDRLRAARDRLEVARATARTAQSRIDGARGALGGAISIAESQLRVAEAAIARGRSGVGATARTRLAEAERQLLIARQESDPVLALDAARRASARASDAEALALYDALGR